MLLADKLIATNTMSNFLKDANTIDKSKTEKVYNKLNTTQNGNLASLSENIYKTVSD